MATWRDQVLDFADQHLGDLGEAERASVATASAIVTAGALQALDPTVFDHAVTPVLAALVPGEPVPSDRTAVLNDAAGRLAVDSGPESPAELIAGCLGAAEAAAAAGGSTDAVRSAIAAALTVVDTVGQVEAWPDEQSVPFADLAAAPGYLNAPVGVTMREAARQVRAIRIMTEQPEARDAMLQEADALSGQVRELTETLVALRGRVSRAYPVINDFDFPAGRATALRVAGPELLADPDRLRAQVSIWVEEVAGFEGYRRQGATPAVTSAMVRQRELVIFTPPGATGGALGSAIEAASTPSVAVRGAEVS